MKQLIRLGFFILAGCSTTPPQSAIRDLEADRIVEFTAPAAREPAHTSRQTQPLTPNSSPSQSRMGRPPRAMGSLPENPVTLVRGGIQGGGGGDFNLAIFWDLVRQIRPSLNVRNGNSRLTQAQLSRLLELMDPNLTHVELTDEPLFVVGARGERTRVDAVNYFGQNKISLFSPVWKHHFSRGMEIRYLILHEFMGLAEIPDVGYVASTRFFSPQWRPISFDMRTLRCYVSTWMMIWDGARYVFRNAYLREQLMDTSFSSPVMKGVRAQNCSREEVILGRCREKDYSRLTRSARIRGDFEWHEMITEAFEKTGARSSELPVYAIDILATIEGESFSNGWGGAAGLVFYDPPMASLVAQLTVRNRPSASTQSVRVLATSQEISYEAQGSEALEISIPLYNTEVMSAIAQAGASLDLSPNIQRDKGNGVLDVHNFMAFLDDESARRGARSAVERERIARQSLFQNLPQVFPLSASLNCHFLEGAAN